MESNNNLESLREMSESQLEALLRYDSPPETPIQLSDRIVFSEVSNREKSNECKNEDINKLNSFSLDNKEQFINEINSQIDFSIFHNDSPNLNQRPNDYDNSIIVTTPHVDEMILETIDISVSKKINSHTIEENYSEFDKNMKNNNTKINDSLGEHRKSKSVKESSVSKCRNDLEELDNIFQKIDFKYLSNLEETYLNKIDFNRETNRQCRTQCELERIITYPKEKIIASCPPLQNSFSFSSSRGSELYSNILQGPITDISIIQNNIEKNINENNDQIFEHLDFENISDIREYTQKTSQCQFEVNLRNLDDDYFSTEDNPTSSSLKHSTNNKMPDSSSIPFSVSQLYEIVRTKYSDFAFIYALSSQLCQDRVPMECFVMLKMGLLLSLVSIGNNGDRPPIPIVAITNDTYMTDYLMTNIGQLGSRFLGPVNEIKTFSNYNWIEADPILLARGGVYYAGDWTRLKIRRTETIFKNLECCSIAVEKSTLTIPLETAIWTHWRSFKYGAKDQQMFNKFLKIFGIPIFVSDDNHEALVDYTLEQASVRIFESTVDHLSINEDDMRNFLVYISQNNVDLSPEAALLLRNYFVTSRSNRQDCLTQQSYIMLKQFAESFAKLSMRKEVSPDDALAAIIMCEHFIENAFNSCDNSPPHLGNFTFIGTVDEYFIKFKKWLNSYLEKYTNE